MKSVHRNLKLSSSWDSCRVGPRAVPFPQSKNLKHKTGPHSAARFSACTLDPTGFPQVDQKESHSHEAHADKGNKILLLSAVFAIFLVQPDFGHQAGIHYGQPEQRLACGVGSECLVARVSSLRVKQPSRNPERTFSRSAVLKCKHASESEGGFVKTQIRGPSPGRADSVGVRWSLRI